MSSRYPIKFSEDGRRYKILAPRQHWHDIVDTKSGDLAARIPTGDPRGLRDAARAAVRNTS